MSRRLVALVLLVAALNGAGTATAADQPPSRDERIEELQSALGEASAAEASALAELGGIRAERAELDASIRSLDAQIADVAAIRAGIQAQVDQLVVTLADLAARIDAANKRLDTATQRAETSAAELYLQSASGPPVFVGALEADSVHDAVVGSRYLTKVTTNHWTEVDALEGLKAEIERLEAEADQQRVAAEEARAEADRRSSELDGLRAEQREDRAQLVEQEERERALVEEIRSRKDEFTAELAALQASSNAISQMLAARQRSQTKATSFTVARPVSGSVTSGFGTRVHPVLGDTRVHNGVDMSASTGTPIKAAASGVVAYAGWRSGYGNTVIIDHGNQYATLYAHASALAVSEGQRVSQGQTVASAGATGLATGAHLHFEVRLLGIPVNPLDYL